jgi:hypothetical protein
MADDEIEFSDIEKIIDTGWIKKKLTDDPRGTRYEIVGTCSDGREAAIICRIKSTGKLLLITIYAL